MKWRPYNAMPKMINLYGYWRSSATWRVRWALEIKGIPYNYVPVNILSGETQKPEHLARHPLGMLPVLETEDGQMISESLAMIEWIEEVFNLKGPSLYPGSALDRAQIRMLCETINADTAPLQTPRVQKRHSSDAAEKLAWAQHFVREGLKAFDVLSSKTRGTFSHRNDLSAADLCLVPQIYNALRFDIDVKSEFAGLFKIYEHCRKLQSCENASPEKQKDATV
jgi:maleylpyruvate isomerase